MTLQLGPIMQYSYVVHNMSDAIRHFSQTLSVGPFFLMESVPFSENYYKGKPCEADLSVAIAYSGNVQIELVAQNNNAPSIFSAFLQSKGEGLQHVGIIADNFDDQCAAFAAKHIKPVQHGIAENGTIFAYLDTAVIPGTMLELFTVNEKLAKAFAFMQEQSKKWESDMPMIYGRTNDS